MNTKKWIDKNCSDLSGKNILINGSTGGIAKEFVKVFARLNANLIFANRNLEKTNNQIKELLKDFPNLNITVLQTDMLDLNSVKNLCDKLKNTKIDYLVLNSAIYNVPLSKTSTGFNNVFQVNFVSQFYLVKTLLPKLESQDSAKIIAISSIANNFCKLNENDIDYSNCKKCNKVYGNSKRFFTFSLQELLKDKKTNLAIVHPGITLTQMTNHYPKAINWLVKFFVKLFFPSPKNACLSVIYGCFCDTHHGEWIGPAIFNIWGKPKLKKLKVCSPTETEKIFSLANKIYDKIKEN